MRKAKQMAIEGFKTLGVSSRKPRKKVENDEKTETKTRSPLKTQSKNIQEEKMKRCSVVLNRVPKANTKTTAKITPSEQTEAKNREKIYDYSFDADKTNDGDKNSEQLQDFFKKLAEEKKITLKKYKPKINKIKTDKTVDARKKPRNKKQQVKSVQSKPNLNQVNNKQLRGAVEPFKVDSNKNVVEKIVKSGDICINDKNKEKNINSDEKNFKSAGKNGLQKEIENKLNLRHRPTHQSTPISTPLRRTRSSANNSIKSTSVLSNITSPCLNIDNSSIIFDNNSIDIDPMPESFTKETNTAVPLRKSQRKSVQSATISSANKENLIPTVKKTPTIVPNSKPGTSKDLVNSILTVGKSPRKSPRKSVHFADSLENTENSIFELEETPTLFPSPITRTSKDLKVSNSSKEKTPTMAPSPVPGTSKDYSLAENTSVKAPSPVPGTSKDYFLAENTSRKAQNPIPGTSKDYDYEVSCFSSEKTPRKASSPVPSTSKDLAGSYYSMERTPQKSPNTSINHCSIFSNRSERSIFPPKTYTPKKHSENTPSKNIGNDKSTFSVASNIDLSDRSNKSNTMASNNNTFNSSVNLVIQDDVNEIPNLFDFQHPTEEVEKQYSLENYFGFGKDDDDVDDDDFVKSTHTNISNRTSKKNKGKSTTSHNAILSEELRNKLRQFLHNPVSPSKKGTKNKTKAATASKSGGREKSPVPSTSRAAAQSTPKIFSDNRENQADIRSVFSAVNKNKDDGHKDRTKKNKEVREPVLFEEMNTVQDRRKSYVRPAKAKQYQKRRVSIDSGSESEHDEGESSPKRRKVKRKKLIEAPQDKDKDELDKFAEEFNSMCDEIDKYELLTVKE